MTVGGARGTVLWKLIFLRRRAIPACVRDLLVGGSNKKKDIRRDRVMAYSSSGMLSALSVIDSGLLRLNDIAQKLRASVLEQGEGQFYDDFVDKGAAAMTALSNRRVI